MKKQRISSICDAPLWRILQDADRDDSGSKILNVIRYLETGRPRILKKWTSRWELTNFAGCRLVRDFPMPIDRFNSAIRRFMSRYRSKLSATVEGCIAVYKYEYGYTASHAFIGDSLFPINTYQVRQKSRAKLRKKITEHEAEALVMLSEFSYISELSKKEEIRWKTK
jgi:hypothetical protein